MKEQNGLEAFNVFASDATTYYDEHYGKDAQSPGAENYTRGYQPLETLPATWYNSILRNLTRQAQQTYLLVSSIYDELKYIVEQGGQTLSDTDAHQILAALKDIFALQAATGTKLGSVLSSTAINKVLVNADGTMTPNALADWTTQKTVASHINALYTNVHNCKTIQTPVPNSDTVSGYGNTFVSSLSQSSNGEITYTKRNLAIATASTSGVVRLSDSITSVDDSSSSMAATPKAVHTVYLHTTSAMDTAEVALERANDAVSRAKKIASALHTPDVSSTPADEFLRYAELDTAGNVTKMLSAPLPVMTGATEDDDGKSGMVPAPQSGDNSSFLRGDGTWTVPDTQSAFPTGNISNRLYISSVNSMVSVLEVQLYTSGTYKMTLVTRDRYSIELYFWYDSNAKTLTTDAYGFPLPGFFDIWLRLYSATGRIIIFGDVDEDVYDENIIFYEISYVEITCIASDTDSITRPALSSIPAVGTPDPDLAGDIQLFSGTQERVDVPRFPGIILRDNDWYNPNVV